MYLVLLHFSSKPATAVNPLFLIGWLLLCLPTLNSISNPFYHKLYLNMSLSPPSGIHVESSDLNPVEIESILVTTTDVLPAPPTGIFVVSSDLNPEPPETIIVVSG